MARHIPEDDEQPQEFDFIEPWRCGSCDEFMFNRDQDGYPSPGAPIGLSVKIDDQDYRVCLVCAEMYIVVLKSGHFREQHSLWLKEAAHKSKLKTGSNYLDR